MVFISIPYSALISPENTHKPIRLYMGPLIPGVNTLYMLFCFFKLFSIVGNESYIEILELYASPTFRLVLTAFIKWPR